MIDLQSLAVYALVTGAAIYVCRVLWLQLAPLRNKADDGDASNRGPCSSCGKYNSHDTKAAKHDATRE